MEKKQLVNSLLVTFAYVLLFVSISYKTNNLLTKWTFLFMVAGALVLWFQDKITQRFRQKFIPKIVIRTVGYILLFLGIKQFITRYVVQHWVWFIILGIVIYNYHNQITERLIR